MSIPHETLMAIWHRALAEEIGVAIVNPSDPRHFANALYAARDQANELALHQIIIFRPNNGEVWLCKKEADSIDG